MPTRYVLACMHIPCTSSLHRMSLHSSALLRTCSQHTLSLHPYCSSFTLQTMWIVDDKTRIPFQGAMNEAFYDEESYEGEETSINMDEAFIEGDEDESIEHAGGNEEDDYEEQKVGGGYTGSDSKSAFRWCENQHAHCRWSRPWTRARSRLLR